MNKHTVAVLVNNQFGVLNRVTSMFRRRQFNISSLNVSETETASLSRITVSFEGDETHKQQLINQLYKLPDVCSIKAFDPSQAVSCELLLIKLAADTLQREQILKASAAFGAVVMEDSPQALVLRLVDASSKIDEFVEAMRSHTILELCRTGSVSLEKGNTTIQNTIQ